MLLTIIICAFFGIFFGIAGFFIFRYFTSKIAYKYAIILLLSALNTLAFFFYSTTSEKINPFVFVYFSLLITVSAIDLRIRRIPDALSAACLFCFIGYASFQHLSGGSALSLADSVIGALLGGIPLLVIDGLSIILTKKDGIGLGDVKLMSVCGLFLGAQNAILCIMTAYILAGISLVPLFISAKIKRSDYIPFAPFISVSAMLWMILGSELTAWYTDLLV